MSLVTTAPAPITTSSTIRTGMMVALEPIDTRLPITVSRHNSLRPPDGPPDEKVSLMNITPWPTKQSSPIVTSSQIKACDCTRVRAPTTDALLDFGERSDKAVIADLAAIEVAGLDDLDPRAEFDVAHAALMHLRLVHDATPSRLSRGVKRSATSWPVSIELIKRGDQLEALAPFQPVHQRRALIDQAIDHMLVIGVMAEAVDVRAD